MEKILKLLASELSFLYRDYGFKIIDSEFTESFGGSAYIVLLCKGLKVRVLQSRDGLGIEFGDNRSKPEWYSLDIIQEFICDDKENKYDGEVNSKNIIALKRGMAKLLDAFSKEKISTTRALLSNYEKERAKRLFD